ncbi:hypothetical protein HK101_011080, partial [Irineochytrium annulatum]
KAITRLYIDANGKNRIFKIPVSNLIEHLELRIPEPTYTTMFTKNPWELNDEELGRFHVISAGWQNAEAKITTLITKHLDKDLTVVYMHGGITTKDCVDSLLAVTKHKEKDTVADLQEGGSRAGGGGRVVAEALRTQEPAAPRARAGMSATLHGCVGRPPTVGAQDADLEGFPVEVWDFMDDARLQRSRGPSPHPTPVASSKASTLDCWGVGSSFGARTRSQKWLDFT